MREPIFEVLKPKEAFIFYRIGNKLVYVVNEDGELKAGVAVLKEVA